MEEDRSFEEEYEARTDLPYNPFRDCLIAARKSNRSKPSAIRSLELQTIAWDGGYRYAKEESAIKEDSSNKPCICIKYDDNLIALDPKCPMHGIDKFMEERK